MTRNELITYIKSTLHPKEDIINLENHIVTRRLDEIIIWYRPNIDYISIHIKNKKDYKFVINVLSKSNELLIYAITNNLYQVHIIYLFSMDYLKGLII